MNKISCFFYNFLKISVTIALVSLVIASLFFLNVCSSSAFQINLCVWVGIALFFCAVIIVIRIPVKYKLCLMLFTAFAVRLVWILNVNTVLVSDFSTIYDAAGKFLAGDKDPLRGYGYLARFPHLVPMMVYMMGMIKLFGSNALVAMKVVSLILSVVTVYLVYILSAYYVKKPVLRLVAMAIAVVYPSFIAYSSTFCTETIGVPLYILTVILFNRTIEKQNNVKFGFLWSGIVLYFSNLFRGVGLIFLIAFSLYIFFFSKVKKIKGFLQLVTGYAVTAWLISLILIGAGVTEQPLWKGKEPSFATLMLKGSNFEHNGTWNVEDATFVAENLKNENLSKECFEIVKQRISERSFVEVVGFYGAKFFSQWSVGDCSGTYWATMNTDIPFPYPLPVPFQIIYTLVLLPSIMIFAANREDKSPIALLMMLLCGFGVMFILLETQPRYSYVANWIFIILAIVGMENLLSENKYTDFAKKACNKHKIPINCVVVGVLTTIINIVTYFLLYILFNISNVLSVVIAWIVSVAAAYVMNRKWIFGSDSFRFSYVRENFVSFFSCRFLTGVSEVIMMWLTVDYLRFSPVLMKIAVSVSVIILNYIAKKNFILKNKSM